MKKRRCAVFLFDGYADWEPALVMTVLNKYSDFSIETFSMDGNRIVSMGELNIIPHSSIEKIDPAFFDFLLLPGGETWEKGGNIGIIPLVSEFERNNKLIAAICGATIILAKAGFLNMIPHTSNMLDYLVKNCPDYKGIEYYENSPCVRSGNIITANGAGMVEFAHEIFKALNILDDETLESWKELYKSGGMINKLYVM